MKNAILVHGWADKQEFYDVSIPTASNSHWFPWLTKQLMVKDIHTVALEMPKGYYPEYDIWKKELERFEINTNTMLIGHSCGGGFLVRWLSENPEQKVGKVILVAPWQGIRFNDEPFDDTFFELEPERTIAQQTKGLYIFNSTDDMQEVRDSVKIIRDAVDDIQYREFNNKGHFTKSSLGTEEFPELLEELLSDSSSKAS
jgi:predicted alpha/beta hydrolase family esterase